MVTPTPTTTPSSPSFANAPIHALLGTPVHEMNETQLREYTQTLRSLRTSSQAMQKQLRIDSESKKSVKPKQDSKDKKLTDEYLSNL